MLLLTPALLTSPLPSQFEDLTGVYQSIQPTVAAVAGGPLDELTWSESDESPEGHVQTFTLQISRPSLSSPWPVTLSYCLLSLPSSTATPKQPAAYITASTAPPTFATFWPSAYSRTGVCLRRGDVIVGIAGTPLQTVLSSTSSLLNPIHPLFDGSPALTLDLTVFRDADATLPKEFVVNPEYGVPFYDCDSEDENSKGEWETLLPAER